jgi:hypothetical protein
MNDMKGKIINLLIIPLLLLTVLCHGQRGPERAGKLEDGKFILNIDLTWNTEQKKQLAELFALDSVLVEAVFARNFSFVNDSTDWRATLIAASMVELSREMEGKIESGIEKTMLTPHPAQHRPPPPPTVPENYGVNNFNNPNAFSYKDGLACFRLEGHSQASSVILSGSFNQWSTMQLPMKKSGSGWEVCISLPPGRHLYKYIVDGRWMHDPGNRLRERDGNRGFNSVVFTYNHKFTLEDYTRARRVVVSGSFNGWNTRRLRMEKTASGWELPLFLREGTHTYKFIVDRNWINDPGNPNIMPDGDGNINSVIGIGDTLYFTLNGFTDAERVVLSGSFNMWRTGELQMERIQGGWQLPYVLGNGNFEYKYIIDGRWTIDPDNPFTVGRGDFTNSFMVNNPNHVFLLNGYEEAENVIVTGTFNGWNTNDYRMLFRDGKWIFPIWLAQGRHSYKFIVDGEWILDPDNPLWEQNEFGTGNSVLWIE